MAESGVLKILYVLDILKKTDKDNPINSSEIIRKLEEKGFHAERKAIGNYIRALTDEMGYEIILCENKNLGWYMIGQEFEDYELKMLVDAVAAAKFLTIKKSHELIRKIRGLATIEGERLIKAGLVMDESLKLVDAKFTIKFDTVMRAIADRKQIEFQYEELGSGNQKKVRRNGEKYRISPYYLGVWDHEYFVVANTAPYQNVSYYRIDMMKNVGVIEAPVRPMSEIDELKEIGRNGRKFGDFFKEAVNLRNGEVKSIRISGVNKIRREVMKKFGNQLSFHDRGEDRFYVNVKAADTEGLYQWIAQFGANMKIEGPSECVEGYVRFVQGTLEQYQ